VLRRRLENDDETIDVLGMTAISLLLIAIVGMGLLRLCMGRMSRVRQLTGVGGWRFYQQVLEVYDNPSSLVVPGSGTWRTLSRGGVGVIGQ